MQDIKFAGLGPQKPLKPPPGPHKYVALLSGLGVGDEGGNPQQLALVVDYLTGLLGTASEHSRLRRVSQPKVTFTITICEVRSLKDRPVRPGVLGPTLPASTPACVG